MAVGDDIGGTRSLLCARITIVGRSSSQEEPWDLKGSGGHVGPRLALDIEYVNSSRVALVWLAGAKIIRDVSEKQRRFEAWAINIRVCVSPGDSYVRMPSPQRRKDSPSFRPPPRRNDPPLSPQQIRIARWSC